ncbi:MAG: DarT ssDNA thymidine ADP-ribosyltransferase family protein [Acidimicrobiaceae bacterium]|nr:DarT ssDNA thymidine ADP-ribosyltransferase family protein [Acidimicrobiaceae bacterium]
MSTRKRVSEAEPQTREQVRNAPRCPEVVETAIERGVNSIVHFTTVKALVGILYSRAVKNRQDLPVDELVQHVFEPNAVDRHLDERWHTYVNLSVTAISLHMFNFSRRRRPKEEWVILKFGPEILGDPGVVFCTTNNIYPAAQRWSGLPGFERLFAPRVAGRYGQPTTRAAEPPNRTTDPQAEVLYPFELSLTHLHTITAVADDVYEATIAALSHFPDEPRVEIGPEAFR